IQSLQNTSIVLNNIYFDFDKSELQPGSFVELARVVKFLNDNTGVKIEISAHSDSKGSDEYNLTLSQKRAESVVAYLVNAGIGSERLIAVGYGETQPVADNQTDEGAAKNRRVEMKVLN
ncbi:MAG TPA: OmpA family protein, partial [Ignavibacteria bacterium]|nr:OmpA family protein [Ignavibacteria bacterium]